MPVVEVFSAPAFAQHSAGNMALPSACSYSHGRSWGFAGLSAIDSVPSSKAGASVFVRPRIANAGCFVAVEGSVGLLARGERLRVMAGHFQSHAGFAGLFSSCFPCRIFQPCCMRLLCRWRPRRSAPTVLSRLAEPAGCCFGGMTPLLPVCVGFQSGCLLRALQPCAGCAAPVCMARVSL